MVSDAGAQQSPAAAREIKTKSPDSCERCPACEARRQKQGKKKEFARQVGCSDQGEEYRRQQHAPEHSEVSNAQEL